MVKVSITRGCIEVQCSTTLTHVTRETGARAEHSESIMNENAPDIACLPLSKLNFFLIVLNLFIFKFIFSLVNKSIDMKRYE